MQFTPSAPAPLGAPDVPPGPPPPVAAVALCEDDESFIAAFSTALAGTGDLALAGVARSLAEGRVLLAGPPAAVLVVDLGLPDGSGIALIHEAQHRWPGCLVLVSTVFGDEAHVIRSLEAGASGYLLKDHSLQKIADEIRTVLAGGSPISPLIARRLLQRFGLGRPETAGAAEPPPRLSPREQQVLEHITRGYSYDEIARRMQVTRNTVLSFVRRIYAKLNVNSQIEAIEQARGHGLLAP